MLTRLGNEYCISMTLLLAGHVHGSALVLELLFPLFVAKCGWQQKHSLHMMTYFSLSSFQKGMDGMPTIDMSSPTRPAIHPEEC
jgi:hypothetical protein